MAHACCTHLPCNACCAVFKWTFACCMHVARHTRPHHRSPVPTRCMLYVRAKCCTVACCVLQCVSGLTSVSPHATMCIALHCHTVRRQRRPGVCRNDHDFEQRQLHAWNFTSGRYDRRARFCAVYSSRCRRLISKRYFLQQFLLSLAPSCLS